MTMLGHNNGPSMEPGVSWRRHSWSKARAALLPTLPIEVVRVRVIRAKALGLPYRTYASVRAASGHDVVGFLFSNNALRVLKASDALPPSRAAVLAQLDASLLALAHPPLTPTQLARTAGDIPLEAARAPQFAAPWSRIRAAVLAPITCAKLQRDGVLVIGETSAEREWAEAGRLAGYLSAERYFSETAAEAM